MPKRKRVFQASAGILGYIHGNAHGAHAAWSSSGKFYDKFLVKKKPPSPKKQKMSPIPPSAMEIDHKRRKNHHKTTGSMAETGVSNIQHNDVGVFKFQVGENKKGNLVGKVGTICYTIQRNGHVLSGVGRDMMAMVNATNCVRQYVTPSANALPDLDQLRDNLFAMDTFRYTTNSPQNVTGTAVPTPLEIIDQYIYHEKSVFTNEYTNFGNTSLRCTAWIFKTRRALPPGSNPMTMISLLVNSQINGQPIQTSLQTTLRTPAPAVNAVAGYAGINVATSNINNRSLGSLYTQIDTPMDFWPFTNKEYRKYFSVEKTYEFVLNAGDSRLEKCTIHINQKRSRTFLDQQFNTNVLFPAGCVFTMVKGHSANVYIRQSDLASTALTLPSVSSGAGFLGWTTDEQMYLTALETHKKVTINRFVATDFVRGVGYTDVGNKYGQSIAGLSATIVNDIDEPVPQKFAE